MLQSYYVENHSRIMIDEMAQVLRNKCLNYKVCEW
jgi:hypothetical protein